MEFIRTKLENVIQVDEIITVLYQKLPKTFVFDGEQHDFWEFIYVDKGEIFISADTVVYNLKQGELAFHKPCEFHTVTANGRDAANIVVVSFSCENSVMDYFINKILYLDDFEKSQLTDILQETEKSMTPITAIHNDLFVGMNINRDYPFGSFQIIKNALERMLINIIRRGQSIDITQRPVSLSKRSNTKKITDSVLEYLTGNIKSRITLEELSRTLNISVSTLKRAFSAEKNRGIIDYFNELKSEAAKELIKDSDMSFTQIAYELGFENIYYFSSAFKKRTGMTPTQYLKSVKK